MRRAYWCCNMLLLHLCGACVTTMHAAKHARALRVCWWLDFMSLPFQGAQACGWRAYWACVFLSPPACFLSGHGNTCAQHQALATVAHMCAAHAQYVLGVACSISCSDMLVVLGVVACSTAGHVCCVFTEPSGVGHAACSDGRGLRCYACVA
jgi:hypothetical protein